MPPTIRWLRDQKFEFPDHVQDIDGMLLFNGVEREDAGLYTCVAHSPHQGFINTTIQVEVVGESALAFLLQRTCVLH